MWLYCIQQEKKSSKSNFLFSLFFPSILIHFSFNYYENNLDNFIKFTQCTYIYCITKVNKIWH